MIHFLVIWLAPVAVGALAGFVLGARLSTLWMRVVLGIGLATMIAAFVLATTSDQGAWAVIPYFLSLGLNVGIAGQRLSRSRIITALATLAAACAGIFLLFQLGCAWSGQCM